MENSTIETPTEEPATFHPTAAEAMLKEGFVLLLKEIREAMDDRTPEPSPEVHTSPDWSTSYIERANLESPLTNEDMASFNMFMEELYGEQRGITPRTKISSVQPTTANGVSETASKKRKRNRATETSTAIGVPICPSKKRTRKTVAVDQTNQGINQPSVGVLQANSKKK